MSPLSQPQTLQHAAPRAQQRRWVAADAAAAAGASGKVIRHSLTAAVTAYNMPLWLLGLRCLGSAAAATCAAMAISRVLHQAADFHDDGEDLDWTVAPNELDGNVFVKSRKGFFGTTIDAFLVALHRPAALFIPLVAVAYSVKEVESYLQAILLWHLKHNALSTMQQSLVEMGVRALGVMDTVIREGNEVACIALGVWVLLRFKERLVQLIMQKSLRAQAALAGKDVVDRKTGKGVATLERVVLPFSGLASWMLVLAGALMAMHVVGVNIQPLLTVGGVSGIIVGLSAQSVMANMISGINLFLSQPFVVGDRVEIQTNSGSRALVGTVERVDPMRTIFRSDAEVPMTIPNKVLSEMIILNESRVGHSRVMASFNKPRVYSVVLPLRYQDFPKMERLLMAFNSCLRQNDSVDNHLPCFVGIQSLDNHSINVILHMHTVPEASRKFGGFRTKLLLDLGKLIEDHGAALAYPVQVNVDSDEDYFVPGHRRSRAAPAVMMNGT